MIAYCSDVIVNVDASRAYNQTVESVVMLLVKGRKLVANSFLK